MSECDHETSIKRRPWSTGDCCAVEKIYVVLLTFDIVIDRMHLFDMFDLKNYVYLTQKVYKYNFCKINSEVMFINELSIEN